MIEAGQCVFKKFNRLPVFGCIFSGLSLAENAGKKKQQEKSVAFQCGRISHEDANKNGKKRGELWEGGKV